MLCHFDNYLIFILAAASVADNTDLYEEAEFMKNEQNPGKYYIV